MSNGYVPQLGYLRDIHIMPVSCRKYWVNYHGVDGHVSRDSIFNGELEVVILDPGDGFCALRVIPSTGRFTKNPCGIYVSRRDIYLGMGDLKIYGELMN